jgi:hypothetical protein
MEGGKRAANNDLTRYLLTMLFNDKKVEGTEEEPKQENNRKSNQCLTCEANGTWGCDVGK